MDATQAESINGLKAKENSINKRREEWLQGIFALYNYVCIVEMKMHTHFIQYMCNINMITHIPIWTHAMCSMAQFTQLPVFDSPSTTQTERNSGCFFSKTQFQ